MMNILVLGGNGFIGSHLVDALLKSNNKITVFDKRKSKYTEEYVGVSYVYGDFNDEDKLKAIINKADVIYHLLSTTVPKSANLNPVFDVESNLISTIKFLKLLKDSQLKKFIYISSGGTVYGNPKYLPIDENHPLLPIGSYGITKVAIESYVKLFTKKFNVPYLIIRPSNPYGPRQNHSGVQGVIASFLYKAVNNLDLDVWGDGKSLRDYIYIQDLIDFFILAGFSKETGEYNLGSGEGNRVNDIIEIINNITNKKCNINIKPTSGFVVDKVVLDISKAKKRLGWSPKISLKQGVRKHFDWMLDSNKN